MSWFKARLFQKYVHLFVSGLIRTDYSKCPPAGQPYDFVIVVCKRQSSERMIFLAGRKWRLKFQFQISDCVFRIMYEEEKYEGLNTFITLLTNLLAPWSRVLLQKLTTSQLVKKFPAFYGTRGSLPHLQVPTTSPYSEPVPSSPSPPHPTSWRSILILSSHIHLGLPSGLFPSGSPPKLVYTFPVPLMCYMPLPSDSSQFDHLNNIGWGVQITKLFIM